MDKSKGVENMRKTYYRAKEYRCGEYRDVYIYPVFPTSQNRTPGKRIRKKPTRKAQEKLNHRHAAEKLIRVLHTNFTEEDVSLTLTWRENPTSDEEAVKEIQKYLRKIRYRYKKAGIELKYVWQVEKSSRGRYHAHMVISGGLDRDSLEKLWGRGYANSKRLQFDRQGLTALAKYMTKSHHDEDEERITYRSYNGSKNLIDPPPEISDSKIRSKKKAKELADMDWNSWHEIWPEYEVTDLQSFYSDEYGSVYIFARLYRSGKETE